MQTIYAQSRCQQSSYDTETVNIQVYFDLILSVLTTFSSFGFILFFSVAFKNKDFFPNSTFPPSFAVMKHDDIDFD